MQMKMALPLKKFTGFQHKGGGRGVFGEALLEFWGGSTPGTHSLFSWSGGLQARRWQSLGESSFPVVLDFRSCQLLRSALRVGARSGTGSLFTLGAQKEPRTLLALGQLHLTEELEIRAPKANLHSKPFMEVCRVRLCLAVLVARVGQAGGQHPAKEIL